MHIWTSQIHSGIRFCGLMKLKFCCYMDIRAVSHMKNTEFQDKRLLPTEEQLQRSRMAISTPRPEYYWKSVVWFTAGCPCSEAIKPDWTGVCSKEEWSKILSTRNQNPDPYWKLSCPPACLPVPAPQYFSLITCPFQSHLSCLSNHSPGHRCSMSAHFVCVFKPRFLPVSFVRPSAIPRLTSLGNSLQQQRIVFM